MLYSCTEGCSKKKVVEGLALSRNIRDLRFCFVFKGVKFSLFGFT